VLVIGADGFIGRRLCPWLRSKGHSVVETTRQRECLDDKRIYLDLLDQEDFVPPKDVRHAFVLAAVTDYEQCEQSPEAEQVNMDAVPKIIGKLLDSGIFTVFSSSVVVFGGVEAYPDEDAPHHPTIAYGRQKSEGEKIITGIAAAKKAMARLAIVRITKSFDCQTRPVPQWLENWRVGKSVSPFMDLFFAPMTLEYICAGLNGVVERGQGGVYHLSGAESLDYADFCRRLAVRLSIPEGLVTPVRSEDAGVRLFFRPKNGAAISMRKTTKALGIRPQPVAEVIERLAAEIGDNIDCVPGVCQ